MDKQKICEEFEEQFVAKNILDCIPEENWKEMKGEVFNFIFQKLDEVKNEVRTDTLKEIKDAFFEVEKKYVLDHPRYITADQKIVDSYSFWEVIEFEILKK